MPVNRRDFIAGAAAAAAACAGKLMAQGSMSKNSPNPRPLRIGMTDWNLGERGVVEKVDLARQIGLDGIQISVLYPDDGLHLRDAKLQGEYRKAALDNGVQICSLAIGNLGPGSPMKSEPVGAIRINDAIEVAANVGTNDILLPFFRERAPKDDTDFNRMIAMFKEIARTAERYQVVVALETSMSAEEHLRIIDGVGSEYIGVYMDPWNCSYYGHNPITDIPLLKDHIHQVHVKNRDQYMDGPNEQGFKWPEVAELLYKVGFKGWYVLETSLPSDNMIGDTRRNIDYVRKHFSIPA
ncbi:MAG: sugar phosphate isomerase/epimerase [Candidatus Glassbacteria bacterium]|nr:sugar phosphate isomerase/epimerase [Candidatus Glassbacteria bacterium]